MWRFVSDLLPDLVGDARPTFESFRELHRAYGRGEITYDEWKRDILTLGAVCARRGRVASRKGSVCELYVFRSRMGSPQSIRKMLSGANDFEISDIQEERNREPVLTKRAESSNLHCYIDNLPPYQFARDTFNPNALSCWSTSAEKIESRSRMRKR
jgi:hypothetical protein